MECGGQRAVWPAANAPGVALSPPAARAALRDRAAAAVDRSSPTRSSPLGVRTNTPPPAAAACPSPTLLETLAFAASAQRPHAVRVGPLRAPTVHRACRILPARAADTAGPTAAGPLDDALSSSKTRPLREPTALDVGRASHGHHRALTTYLYNLTPRAALLESSEAETVLLHIVSGGGAALSTRPLNGTAAWY